MNEIYATKLFRGFLFIISYLAALIVCLLIVFILNPENFENIGIFDLFGFLIYFPKGLRLYGSGLPEITGFLLYFLLFLAAVSINKPKSFSVLYKILIGLLIVNIGLSVYFFEETDWGLFDPWF